MKPTLKTIPLATAFFLLQSCSTAPKLIDCSKEDLAKAGYVAQLSPNPEEAQNSFKAKCMAPMNLEQVNQFETGVKKAQLELCAGVKEFNGSNWEELGKLHGQRGFKKDFYQDMKSKCNVSPSDSDAKKYKKAYGEGQKLLCTKMGGLDLERQGLAMNGTCPEKTIEKFEVGRRAGRLLREYDSKMVEMSSITEKINALEIKNTELSSVIVSCENKIHSLTNKGRLSTSNYILSNDCLGSDLGSVQRSLSDSLDKKKENLNEMQNLLREKNLKMEEANRLQREVDIISNYSN